MRIPAGWKAVVCFLPACLASCGGNDPYRLGKTVPVEGQVFYKGKPLAINEGEFGRVWFHPDPAKGNKTPQVAVGDIDAEGKFTLATRGQAGVPLGWYKVMIVATEQIDPTQPKRKRQSLVPARYTAVQTSPLTVEVVEQPTAEAYHLQLK
jgi:hypothetical protein